MFEKKETIQNDEQMIHVQTIPDDFYGGINPVIKFKKVEKEIEIGKHPQLSNVEKKLLDKSTAAGSGKLLHPANVLTSRKSLIIIGSSLFVVFVSVASLYYWVQSRKPTDTIPAPITTTPEENNTLVPVITTTTEEVVAITTPPTTSVQSLSDVPLDFPSSLLGESADLDKDGLTDSAEELFGTDPSKPDTDEDNYNDSHEIFYLYSPVEKEPSKLINSGAVKDFINPVFGYSIYYPKTWAFGNIDESYRDILLSTITGENVEIRVFDKDPSQSFVDWFGVWAPNERYTDLNDFETYYKEKGAARKDGLVYYFYNESRVYAILYHTTDSNVLNYKSVLTMIARSFRFPGNDGSQVQSQPVETNLSEEVNGTSEISSPTVFANTSTSI